MKRRSKLLILAAVAAVLCCLLVMVTSGADTSGICGTEGDNLTWSFDSSTGKLTISGTGAMKGYDYYTSVPWYPYCSSIKTVEISEGVTNIGRYAFYDCRSLTSIVIPKSVTDIGVWAFKDCDSLGSITVAEGNTVYHSAGNCIIETARKILVVGCSTSVIPTDGSVTIIGSYAFTGCGFTSIKIPYGVTSIGYGAFYDCDSLTSIVISEGVTEIGGQAFNSCNSLTRIEIPLSVTNMGTHMFQFCSNLVSIKIPSSVMSIGNYMFQYCHSLVNIEIPSSVTSIGDGAFESCSALTSIEIPSRVTSIGGSAFGGCSSLTSIEIPSGMTSIGYEAFSYCSSLYVIYNNSELPLSIGSSDFGGVARYAKLMIDKNGNKTYTNDGAEYIDTEDGFLFKKQNESYQLIAYFGGEATVTLPEHINGNSYEIYRMRGVRNVIIPNGVTSIGSQAFAWGDSLTSIEIRSGVTSIGDRAFYGCRSLMNIIILSRDVEIYDSSSTIPTAATINTVFGKIVLAICGVVIIITAIRMNKLTKPIEYKR